ncbi:alpha/beta fold hydrolase [Psychromonas sp.]|uniref:alpha/beta fold hydrolase n=1 Tax=Psychromonas sp. TaxID=1884585 RepID=UPI0035652A0B
MTDTVVSSDGTVIAIESIGNGPGIVLVHGSACDGRDWTDVSSHLQGFRLHMFHRRGRSGSGDQQPYSMEREVEDILAVVNATDAALLVGHSFGALLCLEAMQNLPPNIATVLIEPPIIDAADPPFPSEWRQGLQTMLEDVASKGNDDALVEAFMVHAVGSSPEEVASMKKDESGWAAARACSRTLPREASVTASYHWIPTRFAKVPSRALLLAGTETAPFFKAAVAELCATLPNSQSAELTGQGHLSVNTAPHLVAAQIVGYWESLEHHIVSF